MTRGASRERVSFGVAEWAAIVSVLLVLIGGWVDMRVQHAKAVEVLSNASRVIEDHEARIRELERARFDR